MRCNITRQKEHVLSYATKRFTWLEWLWLKWHMLQFAGLYDMLGTSHSGGPLLDVHGRVIGVNTMKAMGMDGIAFAVPIDEVKRVVRQLTAHGRVLRPYLGLKFIELSEPVAEELNARAKRSAML